MNQVFDRSSGYRPFERNSVVAFAILSGVILWLIPKHVIVRGDDFGYVESLLATLQNGNWTSSEWLGPFNLPLPFLGAAVYSLGENFWMASLGVTAVISGLNFFLLARWLSLCGWPSGRCHAAALAVALSPVWLNKSLEYTCIPPGLALILGALMLWQTKRIGLFFAVVWVALANRQSAVCLLVFPLVSLVREWTADRKCSPRIMTGFLLSMVFVGFLLWVVPRTYAREVWSVQRPASLQSFLGNVLLGLFICAGSAAAWLALRGENMKDILKENLKRPIFSILAMGFGVWLMFAETAFLNCETPGLASFSPIILTVAVVAGAWLYPWHRPFSLEMAAFVAGYVLLVSWRGQWWDYYLLEPLLVTSLVSRSIAGLKANRHPGFAVMAVVMGLLYGGYLSKMLLESEARVFVFETEMRAGRLKIADLSDAPFGYLGWKLFHYAQIRGDLHPKLSDFLRYVEITRFVPANGQYAVWHRIDHRSIHPSGEKWELPPDYRDRRFPLSNDEWSEEVSRSSP